MHLAHLQRASSHILGIETSFNTTHWDLFPGQKTRGERTWRRTSSRHKRPESIMAAAASPDWKQTRSCFCSMVQTERSHLISAGFHCSPSCADLNIQWRGATNDDAYKTQRIYSSWQIKNTIYRQITGKLLRSKQDQFTRFHVPLNTEEEFCSACRNTFNSLDEATMSFQQSVTSSMDTLLRRNTKISSAADKQHWCMQILSPSL